ncbi:MAG: DUF1592 domain-containing protein [Verrucomicrobiales bacterium]
MNRSRLLLGSAALVVSALASPAAPAPLSDLQPFLEAHCFDCHGEDKQKGDLRLDALGRDLGDASNLGAWQGVLDQLRDGAMPPAKRRQPDPPEKQRAIDLLARHLADAYAAADLAPARPVIRRLNRLELRNTLRDLLYLEQPVFRQLGVPRPEDANGNGSVSRHSEDPIREFPADELDHGFDTIGERLVMSDFLLRQIIGAAEECLQLATANVTGGRPEVGARRFTAPIRTEGPGGLEEQSRQFNAGYDVLMQRYREPGASTSIGRLAPSAIARSGVGVSGRYRITVEASAHHQRHPWGELIGSRQDEPMLLGLHLIDSQRGAFSEGNPNTEMLAQWPLPDDGMPHEYSVESWIDAKWLPWLGWENAPYDRGLSAERLVETFLPDRYQPPPPKGAPDQERRDYRDAMARALFTAGYAGPHIRIHRIQIDPLPGAWPPRSHTALYGGRGDEPPADLILAFAQRAWRRPVDAAETARYAALADRQIAAGAPRDEALRVAYTAMLASPNFYYLRDIAGAGDFNLASRLSYFLWSSMPDAELFDLAAAGKLSEPAVLRAQVDRMLDHRNAASFVRRFTESWLRLDKLGSMPPPGGFYFHRQMERQMREQADAYFADLVRRNGQVRDVIDSDYTFLNERTAQWIYKRDDVWGDAFRKVPARPPHGGGMLTLPAAMTATANGVDTSPVIRGVWLLESVLGTPPKPPPPNIEPSRPTCAARAPSASSSRHTARRNPAAPATTRSTRSASLSNRSTNSVLAHALQDGGLPRRDRHRLHPAGRTAASQTSPR